MVKNIRCVKLLDSILLEQSVSNMIASMLDFHNQKWFQKSEEGLLFTLMLCLLSSNVHYESACLYLNVLVHDGFLKNAIKGMVTFEKVYDILSRSIVIRNRNIRYRFPYSKSYQIYKTLTAIYGKHKTLTSILNSCLTSFEARETLMSICCGIGPKQASMFLRDIGYSTDLAIIDRHSIFYMKLLNILPEDFRVTSFRSYRKVEDCYTKYAQCHNWEINVLDFAVWHVVRSYKKLI